MTQYTIESALQEAVQTLSDHKSPSPRPDAMALLAHVISQSSSYLLTWPDKFLTEEDITRYRLLLDRRIKGEPIAYIVGYRDFWTLRLAVDPCTLIPRPDTERLVELALEYLPSNATSLLDLGTGTGAIALSVASERSDVQVIGVDISCDAVALAKKNQQENTIENVTFMQSAWFDRIPESQRFSMILSNPPYIDPCDPHLEQGDVRFEPKSALIAAENGLADIRHICKRSIIFIENNGYLMIEHGYDQGEVVREIFLEMGWSNVKTYQDYALHDRVTIGKFIC